MHKVKNAIILAAGRGSRLKHLTNDIPKPLLAPKGTSFIEGIIKNLKDKGINEIYVVTGYKSEAFDFLESQVTLIHNENWNNGNNITSIDAAKEFIGDSLIINGDVIMKHNHIQNEYKSSLTYVEVNENIDEWIVNLDKSNNIDSFDKNGLNKKGYYQREIIFITEELASHIKEEISDFDMEEYQEYLMLNISKKYNIPFGIFEIPKNEIFDLDTVEEFENYKNNN